MWGSCNYHYLFKCLLYLHCLDKEIKNELVSISHCLFKGYSLKFITWEESCNEKKLGKYHAPTWF